LGEPVAAAAGDAVGAQHCERLVARFSRLLVRAESPDATPFLCSEVRRLEDGLGLTPMSMLRLRWEVAPLELPERAAVAARPRRLLLIEDADDAKRQVRAVRRVPALDAITTTTTTGGPSMSLDDDYGSGSVSVCGRAKARRRTTRPTGSRRGGTRRIASRALREGVGRPTVARRSWSTTRRSGC
jgi:hypothetical protein